MKADISRITRVAAVTLLVALAFSVPIAEAQSGAWATAILEPAGADLKRPFPGAVAMAGGDAIVAYKGSAGVPYRVVVTERSGLTWGARRVLVTGDDLDGVEVSATADGDHLAVGLPGAATGGRVDLYRRNGVDWVLDARIPAPEFVLAFGSTVSMKGDLLVVTGRTLGQGGVIESYRRNAPTGAWLPAGFSMYSNEQGVPWDAHTDGTRIAVSLTEVSHSYLDSGDGQWIVEASLNRSGGRVAVSGEWMVLPAPSLGGIAIHRRVGAVWEFRQLFASDHPFAFSNGRILSRSADMTRALLLSLGDDGQWRIEGDIEVGLSGQYGAALALDGDTALVGSQSLRRDGVTWAASGKVGLADLSGARFGESLAVSRNRLWVGSPGLSSSDHRAGGVWIHALPGATAPSIGPVAPRSPALSRGFGAALSSDLLGNIAVASRVQSATAPQSARVAVYGAGDHVVAPPSPDNEFIVPLAQGRILDLDVAHDFDAFALTWRWLPPGGQRPRAEVLVYSDRGNGFTPTQTIELPDQGDWPDLAYGSRVVVDYDRMVAGVMGYRRHNVFDDYEPSARLPLTLADVPSARGLAANADWVVVPMTDEFGSSVATAYAWTASGGWGGSWRVMKNGFAINGGCKVVAIDEDDRIACLVSGAGGRPEIYRAIRTGASSEWRITGGGPVPGPVAGHGSRFLLAMRGGVAYVGWPQTGIGVAGENVGRVVVMTFDESLFTHGFE